MRPKKVAKTVGLLLAVCMVVLFLWFFLGGGKNTSNSSQTGSISGRTAARVVENKVPYKISRFIMKFNPYYYEPEPVRSAEKYHPAFYAYPASTPLEEMVPNPQVPNAAADDRGKFVIENVPPGEVVLVMDYNADGAGDDRKYGIAVRAGRTTKLGDIDSATKALKEMLGSSDGETRPRKSLRMLFYLPAGVGIALLSFLYVLVAYFLVIRLLRAKRTSLKTRKAKPKKDFLRSVTPPTENGEDQEPL